MERKSFIKSFGWLKDAALKAFVVLLIIAGGYYVYAEIAWPVNAPNATTGVVGMFVGESTKAFGAADSPERGYAEANNLCQGITAPDGNTVTGAHICTSDEMINSLNYGTPNVSPIYTYVPKATGLLWINNGPPGYFANTNDCQGWTVPQNDPNISPSYGSPSYGAVWRFDSNTALLTSCRSDLHFACCK